MTIQFKDRDLEVQLESKAKGMPGKSVSQIASLDLERYNWLVANEEQIQLTWPEFHAFCQTVKGKPHLLQTSQIKRLAILVEDSMRSCTMTESGQYTKENLWEGMSVDELCKKLHQATPLQLFALLDRTERMTDEMLKKALLNQRK